MVVAGGQASSCSSTAGSCATMPGDGTSARREGKKTYSSRAEKEKKRRLSRMPDLKLCLHGPTSARQRGCQTSSRGSVRGSAVFATAYTLRDPRCNGSSLSNLHLDTVNIMNQLPQAAARAPLLPASRCQGVRMVVMMMMMMMMTLQGWEEPSLASQAPPPWRP